MEFFIKQHSLLPTLKLQVFSKHTQQLDMADIMFSMWERDSGIYRVIKRSAKVVKEEKLIESGTDYNYFLEYDWRKKDVKDRGFFEACFDIHFYELDEVETKVYKPVLKAPVSEILKITIL